MVMEYLGCVFSIVGFVCFGLSPASNDLVGGWNKSRKIGYIVFAIFICGSVLLGKKIPVSGRVPRRMRVIVVVSLVFVLVCFYSYFYEKLVKGGPYTLTIIAYFAFTFMSLCSSRGFELPFEAGASLFFLESAVVQLMDKNMILGACATLICVFVIHIHCRVDENRENEDGLPTSNDYRSDEARTPASLTSSVEGESNSEENQQNMEEERVVVDDMQNFSLKIDSFHQNENNLLRRRNKGGLADWNCRSCSFTNSGTSEWCQRCGQLSPQLSPISAYMRYLQRSILDPTRRSGIEGSEVVSANFTVGDDRIHEVHAQGAVAEKEEKQTENYTP